MKITRPQKNKKRILGFGLGVVVVLLIVAGVIYWIKISQHQALDNGPTPEQQKEMQRVSNEEKKVFAEETKNTDNPGAPVPPPTSPDSIELTANKADPSTVTVFTKLKNYADGTCTLTATNGTKVYTAVAPIIYQPEYSMCAGFDIPHAELGPGNWTIKLEATPIGSNAVTKTITQEVK